MRKGRKISGGRYKKYKKKSLFEKKGQQRTVRLGERKTKKVKTAGGDYKTVLTSANEANVLDKKTRKVKKAKITNVLETQSNRFMARQNILLKSAVIDTDIGRARITNSPGQEGKVEAVLIE